MRNADVYGRVLCGIEVAGAMAMATVLTDEVVAVSSSPLSDDCGSDTREQGTSPHIETSLRDDVIVIANCSSVHCFILFLKASMASSSSVPYGTNTIASTRLPIVSK